MTFVQTREDNVPLMKVIPGQFIVTDKGSLFYDSLDGNRISVLERFVLIDDHKTMLNREVDKIYIERKTGIMLMWTGSEWLKLGGLESVESAIYNLIEKVRVLAQQVGEVRESKARCMKIISQSGDIRLANHTEYTMTVWGDTKIILPNMAKGETGFIRLWISINSGKVDFGTKNHFEGSAISISTGQPAMIEYTYNPLKENWVINITTIRSKL